MIRDNFDWYQIWLTQIVGQQGLSDRTCVVQVRHNDLDGEFLFFW